MLPAKAMMKSKQPPPSERRRFLVENLDLPAATGVDGAEWEAFQLRHLDDESTFRIETKSRQIAWSWLAAAESVAYAVLDRQPSMYVSINQDEATEKIRYAKQIYSAIRLSGQPAVKRDTQTELEFTNGARLISLPGRPPRGKARFNVYLDEFAWVKLAREIYTAALPVVTKGGRLRIGSSPAGASGMFWEVAEQRLKKYPGYKRARTPWWKVAAFCVNVAMATQMAPNMPSEVRVDLFGNDRIKAIFANMILEDFQQEYECVTNDGAQALHPFGGGRPTAARRPNRRSRQSRRCAG
jgi:phage FluMu gp28-like protein